MRLIWLKIQFRRQIQKYKLFICCNIFLGLSVAGPSWSLEINVKDSVSDCSREVYYEGSSTQPGFL